MMELKYIKTGIEDIDIEKLVWDFSQYQFEHKPLIVYDIHNFVHRWVVKNYSHCSKNDDINELKFYQMPFHLVDDLVDILGEFMVL